MCESNWSSNSSNSSLYTTEEKVKWVKWHFQGKSDRQIRDLHVGPHKPDRRTIGRTVAKFKKYGTVLNMNTAGRQPSVTSEEYATYVLAELEVTPDKSHRQLSQEIGISKNSINRIYHKYKHNSDDANDKSCDDNEDDSDLIADTQSTISARFSGKTDSTCK